jgi:hypothetical protein
VAASFEMEPEATRAGLVDAGMTRTTAAAATPPPEPPTADHYTVGFLSTSSALLGSTTAAVAGDAQKGLGAATVTVSAMEDAEAYNAGSLKI